MLKVYNCIIAPNDLWLVGLAGVVCFLASYAAINLLRHARDSIAHMRQVWLAVSALSTGVGIWATHFIAVLAFSGAPYGYNFKLTFLSLLASILLTGLGLAAAMRPNWRPGPWLGGAVVGGGIALMHYIGLTGFEVAGIVLWDPVLVAVSILSGAVIGAASLPAGLHGRSEKWKVFGALLLTLAVCTHHFTVMAAITVIPDPTVEVPKSALPAEWIAAAVGVASFLIVALALTGVALDLRERRRIERDLRARRETEQHIHYLAHHDALTSLPNRKYFNARMDEEVRLALAKGEKLAVLCLDIDRFKEVNDLFGHAAGDKVLQAAASRIKAVLDRSHMLARLGGDEFAIVVPHLANSSEASQLAAAVLEALRSRNKSPDVEAISSSIGIAICPDDATEREALLVHADTALHRAKTEGRSTHRFFEAKIGADVRLRRMIEHDLRHAIMRNELRLVYQPQKDVQKDMHTGFEALLRWRHPERGEVSPSVFVPIAEESGAILTLGDWVLKMACRDAAGWTQPLTVAVNVSGIQLHNPDFVQKLHEILMETSLPPSRLEIEITETALVRDFNRALTTLRRVKALGVRIAIDDFGTGYSSLANLRAFPFDKIKIDGSFVKSVDSSEQAATIVRAVLGIGRGFGLPVLAEGVETDRELRFLQQEGCDEAQGYLLGRPASIDTFRDLTHAGGVESEMDRSSSELLAGIA